MPEPEIQIRGEPGADPTICRFIADRPLFAGGSMVCSSLEEARGSPLLESLFSIEGITQAWIRDDTVMLQKMGAQEWPALGKRVGSVLRDFIRSGIPFIPPSHQLSPEGGAGLEARIRDILERQINPGVAGHGGKIELIEVRGSSVYLKMSGGCQGCGAAKVTLKQGVEKALRAQIPGITEVIDVTDHDSGRNPFYSRTR